MWNLRNALSSLFLILVALLLLGGGIYVYRILSAPEIAVGDPPLPEGSVSFSSEGFIGEELPGSLGEEADGGSKDDESPDDAASTEGDPGAGVEDTPAIDGGESGVAEELTTAAVVDELMRQALLRWRPRGATLTSPRFDGQAVRLVGPLGAQTEGVADRFLLSILEGFGEEELTGVVVPRSRDAVLRRARVLREIPGTIIGIYGLEERSLPGVWEYRLLIGNEIYSITIYERNTAIEDIEIISLDSAEKP